MRQHRGPRAFPSLSSDIRRAAPVHGENSGLGQARSDDNARPQRPTATPNTGSPRHVPQPTRSGDQSLSFAAPRQPGPLAAVGRRGARRRRRATNRPVLLVDRLFAACHWCHVMAHESFEDAGDRRADERIFRAISRSTVRSAPTSIPSTNRLSRCSGQHGGWPLTMFLTPEGEPFWGGTYFPPTAHFGRPGFRRSAARNSQRLHATSPKRSKKNNAGAGRGAGRRCRRPAGRRRDHRSRC